MIDEVFTALTEAAFVLRFGIDECPSDQIAVEFGIIFGDSLEQVLKNCLFGP